VVTNDQVMQALAGVDDPEIGRPITELDMVEGVDIDGGVVTVDVLLTVPGCPLKDKITKDVTAAVSAIDGVEQVHVRLGSMTEEQRSAMARSCAAVPSRRPAASRSSRSPRWTPRRR
jgi:ATP-binding protein involved in chromosome partitioning